VALLALLPGAGQTRAAVRSGRHTPTAAPPAFSPAIQRQLQQALDQTVANPAVPGAIVGIWIPGRGTWVRAAGLADRATRRPMQVQDYTRIGSITKTFIGTLVLQLVGEGKLGLDDPIQQWAPEVPNARHITVRELLNMSSGLYDYFGDRQWLQQAVSPRTGLALRQWTPQQLVRFAVAHKPYFPPGRGYHYSSTNFILLGLIVEQVTGQPVEDVLRARILRPLGLQHTFLPTSNGLPAPNDVGYYPISPHRLVNETTMNPSGGWTAGAMISTLADLHTWAQALATGALLRPAQQRQRLTWNPYSAAATHGLLRYGLGLMNVGGPSGLIGHGGSVIGFNTDMWYLPVAHATFVVMANSHDLAGRVNPADDLARQIVQIVFAAPSPH
jgi:D-alanyl-D-alanine carboxypeptidase